MSRINRIKGGLNIGVIALVLSTLLLSCTGEEKKEVKKKNQSIPTEKLDIKSTIAPTFMLLPPMTTGINFINKLPETPQINVITYQYFHNGGGVAVGDINNDGLPDIYFSSNLYPNELYLNKGNFKFENINAIARATGDQGWATGVTMVDINNDGLLDIYVCKSGKVDPDQRRNKLYVNQGDLKFIEQAAKYGVDDPSYSTQAYFLDYDKDGDLDMYLLNHSITPIKPKASNIDLTFERDPYAGDKFFENQNGKYVDVSEKAGIKGSPIGFGLSISIGDVNGDNYPDIYVCNDYLERDYLYINNRKKGFKDELKTRTNHISNFSMGSDIADINNDGYLDFMIVDMAAKDNYRSKTNMSGMDQKKFEKYVENGLHYQYMINTLQLNKGNGTFSEVAQLTGVDKTDWSWSALFMDYDQDGKKDLYVTNGLRKEARNNDFVKKKQQLLREMQQNQKNKKAYLKKILDNMPEEKIPNLLFHNEGHLTLAQQEQAGVGTPSFSNGAAYGDFDGDGDLDLVVNNIDHEAFIYQNVTEKGNYIAFKLEGKENNSLGIGCKVTLKSTNGIQVAEHYLTRGYQSSSYGKLHFGVGEATSIAYVQVDWPNGKQTILKGIDVNQTFTIKEEDTRITSNDDLMKQDVIKTTVQSNLFQHKENIFDDFAREVLLPHKMSQMGPALAVGDVNKDGLDDFYVGGAKNQHGRLFYQNTNGTFSKKNSEVIQKEANAEENICVFADWDNDGDVDIYIGTGGNESTKDELKDYLFENVNGTWKLTTGLPEEMRISTGAVAFNDFDKDGDLDVFVGSRQTPGKYPYASKSWILKNNNGQFEDVTNLLTSDFDELGMVSTANWTDVDADGTDELVLAGEWMPILIYKWNGDKLVNVSKEKDVSNSNGWWYAVKFADIDNDGDQDMIAGNLGLNYKYQATADYPFGLFYGDLNGDGKSDIVLSYEQNGEYFPLRGRQCSSQQIPEITQKFPSYDLFGKSTVNDVYAGQLDSNQLLLVYDFRSAIFMNDNGVFTRQNFSNEYQYFNWSSIDVMDVNNDGNLDIVSGGNLYEAEVETPRGDAGNGLVLFGDGKGNFSKATTTDINWGNSNVKSIRAIKLKNTQGLVVGASNEVLKIVKF